MALEAGPNGCTCGFNGDCNCPFVPSAGGPILRRVVASGHDILVACGHGKLPGEWCETCDGDARDDDQEDGELDECTCARGPFERGDDLGSPCSCCGRIVR